MRRPLAAATIAAVLFLQAPPAAAAPSGRVVLVTLDGTRLADWRSPRLPALGAVIRDGAVGLLSTRTASNPTELGALRGEAYRTLGAGRISRIADAGTMFRALRGASRPVNIITTLGAATVLGSGRFGGSRLPDATFPTGERTGMPGAQMFVESALQTERVIVVDLDDSTRVEQIYGVSPGRASWMRLTMTRADAFIAWLRTRLSPDDTLIVASLTPPLERQRARRFLSAVAIAGPSFRPGTLTSATTERAGVVTIADLAPTILRLAGAPIPASMTGRPMRSLPSRSAPGQVVSLERDLIHASALRGPLLRGGVVAASVLTVLALLTVLAGRGVGRPRGLPTTWRGFVETGLVAIVALPLTLFVEPLFGVAGLATTTTAVVATCVGVALVSRAAIGSRAAIPALLGATAVLILADLSTEGWLAARSPLSYLIAEGARFHGIGNEAMGVVIGSVLLAAAAVLDRRLTARRAAVAVAALVVVAGMMAAPNVGSKFGSVPAAVPAFAIFAVLAAGRRFTVRALLGVAIVTVLAGGLAFAAHALVDGGGTHVARAAGEGGGEVFGRKAGAAGRLLALSYWIGGLAGCGASVALLAWRRRTLIGRGLWGRPATRAALICCAVAAAGAAAANDAGVIAAAWVALLVAGSFFSAFLVPADP